MSSDKSTTSKPPKPQKPPEPKSIPSDTLKFNTDGRGNDKKN